MALLRGLFLEGGGIEGGTLNSHEVTLPSWAEAFKSIKPAALAETKDTETNALTLSLTSRDENLLISTSNRWVGFKISDPPQK